MEQKTLKINSKSIFCSISLDLSQGFVKKYGSIPSVDKP